MERNTQDIMQATNKVLVLERRGSILIAATGQLITRQPKIETAAGYSKQVTFYIYSLGPEPLQ